MKTQRKLTALSLSKLEAGDHQDHAVPGLVFRVGAKRRTWTLRYKIGDKQRRDILGYYVGDGENSMGLAAAREAAQKLLQRVEAGAPVDPAPAIHPKSGGLTVGDVIDRFEKARRLKGGRIKSLDLALRTVRNGLDAHLKLPATQLSKGDLRAARDKISKRAPMQANRFLSYLGPIWKWAASEDHVEVNFVPAILKTAKETKRDRILTHAEIKKVWAGCDHLGTSRSAKNFGKLVRFLLLTGQRLDEGASIRYGDLLDGIWKQGDNKSSRPHRLKLSKNAVDLIGTGEAAELVFPGDPGKKISGFSKHKKALDTACGVKGWRLHDLRRTFASGLQDLGVDEMTIKACLNHSLGGLSEVYMRATLEPQKSEALRQWADQVDKIVGQKKAA